MNWWVLTATFLAVNLDFFFILLLMLDKYKLKGVIIGYLSGVLILVIASYFAGQILAMFLPEWILGVLGILPIWMAIHDSDEDPNNQKQRSPIITVLVTYLSVCAGCNLSIFLPILTNSFLRGINLCWNFYCNYRMFVKAHWQYFSGEGIYD